MSRHKKAALHHVGRLYNNDTVIYNESII